MKRIFVKLWDGLRWVIKKIGHFFDYHKVSLTLTLLVFLFFLALFWKSIFISLKTGQQGIRWSRFSGTKVNEYYGEGLHVIWPFDIMYIYNTRIQSSNDSLQILTSEGLTIGIDYTYRFYAYPDSIPVIHQRLGVDYANTIVMPEVKAASMSIIGNYTPEELYKISTLVIQSSIKFYLSKELLTRNIVFDDYLIKKIRLPDVVSKSIEKKMVAEQLSYEFNYKLGIEAKEAQRKRVEAQGIKDFEAISGISILKWKGLEVTSELAKSENSKIIIMGSSENGLPLLLNTDDKK